jgi:UDP-glucose 4-epimerase
MADDILLTGLGFIGRHVAVELLHRGFRVSVLDRRPNLDAARLLGVQPIIGDVRDATLIRQLVPCFSGVINLAGLLGTSELIDDPAAAIETNIAGAVNIFQGCRAARQLGQRVPCVQITVGNYFMNNPYSITKATSERFADMFNVEHGTDIRVVRALNAYGPHQKHRPVKKVIPNFVRAALMGEPVNVYGDGEQIMDMIDVRDVARILVDTLLAPSVTGIISAGTGRRLTINEIARMVIRASGSSSELRHLPMRPGEPQASVVLGDPSTLAVLGIDPGSLVPFEIGIAETVAWYSANRAFLDLPVPEVSALA